MRCALFLFHEVSTTVHWGELIMETVESCVGLFLDSNGNVLVCKQKPEHEIGWTLLKVTKNSRLESVEDLFATELTKLFSDYSLSLLRKLPTVRTHSFMRSTKPHKQIIHFYAGNFQALAMRSPPAYPLRFVPIKQAKLLLKYDGELLEELIKK